MDKQQKSNELGSLPIPPSPQFSSCPISAVIPTLQCVAKIQKWNSEILQKIEGLADNVRSNNEGCTALFKVSMQAEWGTATLSNFLNRQINILFLEVLEHYKRVMTNDAALLKKYENGEQCSFSEQLLHRIFRFYAGKFGSEFKLLREQLVRKIQEIYPDNQFYKSLRFQLSSILLKPLQKLRYDLTRPDASPQLIFHQNSQKKYGLELSSPDQQLLITNKIPINPNTQNSKTHKHSSQQLQQITKNYQQIINQKQKSIRFLNNLISNQQQQLNYRENQVQILSGEIKKLLAQQQNITYLQERNQSLEKIVKEKQRSIVQLNKLINNQEQQLYYRENQVEILTQEIKKLMDYKKQAQKVVKN